MATRDGPPGPRDPALGRSGADRSPEQVDELLDAGRPPLRLVRVPGEQARVELGRDEGGPQALVPTVLRRVEPCGQRGHGPAVGGEEQTGLAAEVLEDRALRDAELAGHVLDPRALVAMLGEVAHRGVDDELLLGGRTATRPGTP